MGRSGVITGDEDFQAAHTPFDFSKFEAPYEVGRIEILTPLIPDGRDRLALDVGCGPGFYTRLFVFNEPAPGGS